MVEWTTGESPGQQWAVSKDRPSRALTAELIEFMAHEQENDVTLSLLVSSGPFL